MTRRLFAATASAVLILGLAACDDGKGPVTTPPPDLGFEPQTSDGGGDESGASDGGGDAGASDEGETRAAPDIPAPDPEDFPGMDKHTHSGAVEAFRYYIAMVYWSHQDGSTSKLNNLHSEDCSGCDDLIDQVEISIDKDYDWSPVPITTESAEHYKSENYEIEVGYIYIVGEHSIATPDGKVHNIAEEKYTSLGGMTWSNGSWLVNEIQITETQAGA
ncbi:DUF6318 family protein [Brachybacterium sp. Marseille-Q7125]|uniref:DUF6318 family protein n=1 Tax=Brachybacterium sp. Marseille-Q7125 TaxID=2932815 RepID=UPI001FF2CC0D|nr:DUF6318 family protein [Brachybacterium sp. Marseille-Q7125]